MQITSIWASYIKLCSSDQFVKCFVETVPSNDSGLITVTLSKTQHVFVTAIVWQVFAHYRKILPFTGPYKLRVFFKDWIDSSFQVIVIDQSLNFLFIHLYLFLCWLSQPVCLYAIVMWCCSLLGRTIIWRLSVGRDVIVVFKV